MKSMSAAGWGKFASACAIVCFFFMPNVRWASAAGTLRLPPVADVSMHEIAPTANMGGHTHFAAGTTEVGKRSRGLVRFDLSGQLPEGATVQAASVILTVTRTPALGGVGSTFGLHRVFSQWGEGTKTGNLGSAAEAGELTWNERLSGGEAWTSPGGAAPGDFFETASGSFSVAGKGVYVAGPSAGLLEDVRFWLGNPDSNFGWMVISQSEEVSGTARGFGTREEGATAAVLQIEYAMPGDIVPPAISVNPVGQVVPAGGTVVMSVVAEGSQPLSYQWQFGGVDIPGGTGDVLALNFVQSGNAGVYRVIVSNPAGSVIAGEAVVSVTPPEPPRILGVEFAGGRILIRVVREPGIGWVMESTDAVGSGVWSALATVAPAAGTEIVQIEDGSPVDGRRFYRIRIVE
ncbi:MAG: DNRLRE domain-containing protein [Verrucomicrobia bacterium]|nr:DNRLRE domain-containing protein [Verrucomicrobiota bacterium]